MRAVTGIALAVVACLGSACSKPSTKGQAENVAIAEAWHRLDHCLVGKHELPNTPPHAIAEILAIQKRASGNVGDWPSRCASYAKTLDKLLEETPLDDAGAFDPSEITVQAPLRTGKIPADIFLDSIFREGRRRFGRPAEAPTGVPDPPAIAVQFPPGALTPLLPLSTRIDATRWSDGNQLAATFNGYQGICRMVVDADPPTADCRYLPDAGPERRTDYLPRFGDGAPSLYQARGGSWHRRDDGGELLPCSSSERCFGFVDDAGDAVAVADLEGGGYDLIVVRDGEATTSRLDRPGSTAEQVAVMAGRLLWTEKAGDKLRLFERVVDEGGLGVVESLAAIPERPWRASCVYQDDVHLYFHDRTYGNGEVGPGRIVSRMKGRWLEPRPVDMASGELSCGPGGAVIHGHDVNGESIGVWMLRCDGDGCRKEKGSFTHEKATAFDVVPIGDRVALFEVTNAVTLRLAPLAEIDGAARKMIMLADGQVGDLVHAVHSSARGDHVVALVRGGEALHALLVDVAGNVRPFSIRTPTSD
jgi:hypothetical protein